MDKKEVFELHFYDYLPDQKMISFKGRAYEDVEIGDNLLYVTEDGEECKYTIRKIITYRKELDFLSGGMTGELFVTGKNQEFKVITRLYM